MTWSPRVKPPSDVCPERFCFYWAERGDQIDTSGGEYDTFEEAVAAAQTVVFDGQCGCVFGTCARAVPSPENRDWYEPNERLLKNAGLPWFYFIASAENVATEFRKRYVSESAALWGSEPRSSARRQQAVAADTQQLVPIDPWYRSGGGHGAPAAVSAVGRS